MADNQKKSDIDRIVDKWATENGVSESVKAALLLEMKGVEIQRKSTLDRVKGCMGYLFLAGSVAVGSAAAVYTVKQAADAVPGAAEDAAAEIFDQRVEMLKSRFAVLEQESGDLLLKLMAFMIAIKNTASSIEGLANLAGHVWDGLWADGADYLANGDTSPDKSLTQILELVKNDPILLASWTEVESAYSKVIVAKDNFAALAEDLKVTKDEGTAIFWKEYKEHFWDEMRQKGEGLKTTK